MGAFAYRATTREGRIVDGTIEAPGKAGVIAQLRSQGYIPLSVQPAGTAAKGKGFSLSLPSLRRGKRVRGHDLMLFTRELATLLRAGLPLDRSLQSLAALTENPTLKGIVGDVLSKVQQGKSLSEALAEHGEVFPPLYVNMVRAGEAGGVVESVLERLSEYLESSEKTRDEIRSAMVYPSILGLVGAGTIVILLTYVLPKFTSTFTEFGVVMPTSTRLVMAMSDAIQAYWWAFLAVSVVMAVAFRQWRATPAGRFRWDGWMLTAPLVGDLTRKLQIARLARTLGTMIKSGVPLLQSLEIVRAIIANTVINKALTAVQKDVSEGKGLAGPLEKTGVFPQLALQMVAVGEDTGRLDEMLLVVSEHYDREVSNAVSRLMSLMEPAMLVIMGVVAGFIVISMMAAVFSVNTLEF